MYPLHDRVKRKEKQRRGRGRGMGMGGAARADEREKFHRVYKTQKVRSLDLSTLR